MRKLTIGLTAVFSAFALCALLFWAYRIHYTLKDARRQVADEGKLAFDLVSLDRRSAGLRGASFERLASPSGYTTGAAFAGKIYMAGAAGLAVFDQLGGAPRLLQTGLELPPAPVVALAEGRVRGQEQAQLIAATRGEGVLFFGGATKDGAQKESLTQLRPHGPDARDVTAILPLASGDLLIGTQRVGLLIYNGKTLTLFHPSLAGVAVTALAGDEGDFWIGTRTRGVLHWHAGQLDAFDTDAGMPDAQVEDIAVSKEGVFVGTPLGVAVFDGGRLSRVQAKGVFAHALAVDGSRLVIATIDQGVREISLTQQRAQPMDPEAMDEGMKVARFFTADGALLAVTDAAFLRRESSGSWKTIWTAAPEALADRNVAALSFSPDGRLWIGYFDRGLDVLNPTNGHTEHIEDDHIFCVNRIVNDPQRHTVDVATANGLVLFDAESAAPKERQVLLRRDGLIADQVTDIAFTRDGLTLATPAGLTFVTASGAQSLYAFHGLVNNHVYALAAEPASNRMMAGTLGGISIVDDQVVRRNLTVNNSGLKHNWITAIVRVPQEESADNWFVGTYGSGVMQMDAAGHITAMEGATRQAVINPNAMLETQRHVFAGTLGGGLLVYDRDSRRWSQITDGLPSLNVTAFAENNGQVYIGTDNGIVRIAEARLQP